MSKEYEQAIQRKINLSSKHGNIIKLMKTQETHIKTITGCSSTPTSLVGNVNCDRSSALVEAWSNGGSLHVEEHELPQAHREQPGVARVAEGVHTPHDPDVALPGIDLENPSCVCRGQTGNRGRYLQPPTMPGGKRKPPRCSSTGKRMHLSQAVQFHAAETTGGMQQHPCTAEQSGRQTGQDVEADDIKFHTLFMDTSTCSKSVKWNGPR